MDNFSIVDKLRGNHKEQVKAFYKIYSSVHCESWPKVLKKVLYNEIEKTLCLIKENTLIKRKAFSDTAECLAELIQNNLKELNLSSVIKIKDLLSQYRESEDNFISLRQSVGCLPDQFSYLAFIKETAEAFLFVSQEVETFLVDYDFTLMCSEAGKQNLFNEYRKVFSKHAPCQICFVKKKFGPIGPIKHASTLLKENTVINGFEFDQDSTSIRGNVLPNTPIVILYDLIVSGNGIANAIYKLNKYFDNTSYDCPSIIPHVLFAYKEPQKDYKDIPEWHIIKTKDNSIAKAINSFQVHPWMMDEVNSPFENCNLTKLEAKRISKKSTYQDWVYANSEEIREKYAGQWVAIYDGNVLHSGNTMDFVEQKSIQDKYDLSDVIIEAVVGMEVEY